MKVWFLLGVLLACQAEKPNENAWSQWADWKNWMTASGASDTQKQAYWNNYGNWKQWAEKAEGGGGNASPYGASGGQGGSPWSSTPYGGGGNNSPQGKTGGGIQPNKQTFDDWRKWNLAQEGVHGDGWKNYGRWQSWAEKNGEGDYAAGLSFEEWSNRDNVQPVEAFSKGNKHEEHHEGHKKGREEARHKDTEASESDQGTVDLTSNRESREQWIKRDTHTSDVTRSSDEDKNRHSDKSNSARHRAEVQERVWEHRVSHDDDTNVNKNHHADATKTENTNDWQNYIPGGKGGKGGKGGSSNYAQGGDWQNYIPNSAEADVSQGGKDYSAGGDWQKYIPKGQGGQGGQGGATSNEGGDWQQYVPEAYRKSVGQGGGAQGGAQGGGSGSWKSYIPESYRESVGNYGNQGGDTPVTGQTLVSKGLPKPGSGLFEDKQQNTDNAPIDFRKYVPETYLKYVENANSHGKPHGEQPEQPEQPQQIRDHPAQHRHRETGEQPQQPGTGEQPEQPQQSFPWRDNIPAQYRHFIPDEKTIAAEQARERRSPPAAPELRGEQPEQPEQAVPWRDNIPAEYRHFVPDDKTIAAQQASERRASSPATPELMNAAAIVPEEASGYSMAWLVMLLCVVIAVTTSYAYKRYAKRLQYDNLNDTRIARSEATDVDHLLLV